MIKYYTETKYNLVEFGEDLTKWDEIIWFIVSEGQS